MKNTSDQSDNITHTRVTPSMHRLMTLVYARILRGVHYRHEFARRHPEVVAASNNLFAVLKLAPDNVAAYKDSKGNILPKVIADAYRRSLKTRKGNASKALLKDYFTKYGVIPVSERGMPFLGEDLRFMLKRRASNKRAAYQQDPIEHIADTKHEWLKTTFNELMQFEIFAIAEFSLPRTIMMPVILLADADTKTMRAFRTAANIPSSNHSCTMYMNPMQTDDVLGDYLKAALEQAREGEMLDHPSASRYETIRLDCKYYERSLHALDVKPACGTTIGAEQKDEFYRRYNEVPAESSSNSNESREYFKDSLAMARRFRDNWRLIL